METEKSRPFVARWRDAVLSAEGPAKPLTRLVLLALAKYMSGSGQNCWPSVEMIGTDTALAKRSVLRHLAEAEQAGWISVGTRGVNGQGWRRNAYTPTLPNGGDSGAPRPMQGGATESPRKGGGGDNDDTNVVPESPERGATEAHEQDHEQEIEQGKAAQRAKLSTKKQREAPFLDRPDGLPEAVTADTWAAFARHRKKIGKPLTGEAVQRLVPRLCRMGAEGHDPEQALDNSIVNGWTGVFEPKPGEATARPSQRRASPSDHAIAGWD